MKGCIQINLVLVFVVVVVKIIVGDGEQIPPRLRKRAAVHNHPPPPGSHRSAHTAPHLPSPPPTKRSSLAPTVPSQPIQSADNHNAPIENHSVMPASFGRSFSKPDSLEDIDIASPDNSSEISFPVETSKSLDKPVPIVSKSNPESNLKVIEKGESKSYGITRSNTPSMASAANLPEIQYLGGNRSPISYLSIPLGTPPEAEVY